MLRQIKLLTGVQICNLFGFNEFRHTKDKGKRRRWMALAAVWLFLLAFLELFVISLSKGLAVMGLGRMAPAYLFASVSVIILFFSFFRAGSVIFSIGGYEAMASLPVTGTAIVVSRFLTMYITDLAVSLLVMIPGLAVCGASSQTGAMFWVYGVLGTLFLPLFPITIATALGAAITAVSSRMRRKSLVSSALTVLLAVAAVVASTAISAGAGSMTEEALKDLASAVSAQIGRIYPPAAWFGGSLAGEGGLGFLLFLAGTLALFALTVFVLQRNFGSICSALNATSAKNNYKLEALKASSPVRAMFRREFRRYFASSIYVSNTMIGYILMVAASAALLIAGPETVDTALGIPGVTERALPFVLAVMAALCPMSSCSISMEGKQWWITQSLPVSPRDVFKSKILVNLAVAAPAWLISTALCLLAVRPAFLDGLWIALIPAAYILFSAVAGITINLALPVMNWENETRVVKQSASTLVAMLVCMVTTIAPAAIAFSAGSLELLAPAVILAVLALSAALYVINGKKKLIDIC